MEKFINASSVKGKKEKVDKLKIDSFIRKFNSSIKKNKLVINNALDGLPTLNDNEFFLVSKMANEAGWMLSKFSDNYQSTSYRIEKIEECKVYGRTNK